MLTSLATRLACSRKGGRDLQEELEDWAHWVEGHFQARRPWYSYHETLQRKPGPASWVRSP